MDEIIQKLNTPGECMGLALNVRDRNPDLAREARRRAVELRAASHGIKSPVELELLKAVYAYEEVLSEKNKRRTRATYTWRMINRHGIIVAAERAVNRKIEAKGYKVLAAMGLHDLTFEAVIIRHPDKFSQEVVARAKERLEELKKDSRVGGIESIIGANNSINAAGDSRALHCQWGEIMSLRDVSRLLAAKRPFMFSFMDRYIFSQVQVPRQETLANSANFMKMIDFCLRTRQRAIEKDFDQAQEYFADDFKEIKEGIICGNWPETLRLIYDARGVGQKIGSLILEVLIHYGEANQALEPKLFVPIDTHVRRILSECLGLSNVPSIGTPVWASIYRDFQQFLADNSAEGTPRIYFDYLWFVGKVFCRKITENDERYSKGYRLCSMCWIKDHCTFADKWFTNYRTG